MHLNHGPSAPAAATIGFDDLLAVDIRVGTIVDAQPFPEARKPAWRLTIDFGAVVNLPPRQIGPMMSEVLVLGFPDTQGNVVLVAPERAVPDGGRLF